MTSSSAYNAFKHLRLTGSITHPLLPLLPEAWDDSSCHTKFKRKTHAGTFSWYTSPACWWGWPSSQIAWAIPSAAWNKGSWCTHLNMSFTKERAVMHTNYYITLSKGTSDHGSLGFVCQPSSIMAVCSLTNPNSVLEIKLLYIHLKNKVLSKCC